MTAISRVVDGIMHAKWCHLITPPEEPALDEEGEPLAVDCNCDPCTTCEGHGAYGDEDGKTMNCLACYNDENRTHRKSGARR